MRAQISLRVVRFDGVQRAAHWATAGLFGLCTLTALPLYFGSVERLVGRHVLVEQVHVWAGIALPVPIALALVGPWGARMRQDVRRINRWTRQEISWITSWGGRIGLRQDKFNPGQKLNAILVAGAIAVMLGTGVVLQWFRLFPVGWRVGATFVHEVLAFLVVVVIAGHVIMAVTHRDALRSMVRGWVTETWAERHAPRWLEELAQGRQPDQKLRETDSNASPTTRPTPPARDRHEQPSPG